MPSLYLFTVGVGIWGINIPVGWGFAIVSLGLVDRHRPRRHAHLGHPAPFPPGVAHLHQSLCRGHDPLCRLLRRAISASASWADRGSPTGSFPTPTPSDCGPSFAARWSGTPLRSAPMPPSPLLFWYVGLIPDLAAMRDRAENLWLRYIYGLLAMGWRGAASHWHRYDSAYLLLAVLATPLVVSVHSVVSLDFAVGVLPGWHSTVFPPYFVAGAIFSGFAMVLTLLIPLRKIYKLEDFITLRHLDNMAKVMLATGLFVAYGYLTEGFTAWYSGNPYERFWLFNRSFGPYAWAFWALMLCNVLAPQALWFGRVRTSPRLLFVIALVINVGMWLERYVIIVVSLHRDFLPSSWATYSGTIWDWAIFIGTIGLFLTLIFLFVRVLPMISIFEMDHLLAHMNQRDGTKKQVQRQDHRYRAGVRPNSISTQRPLHGLMAEFDSPR